MHCRNDWHNLLWAKISVVRTSEVQLYRPRQEYKLSTKTKKFCELRVDDVSKKWHLEDRYMGGPHKPAKKVVGTLSTTMRLYGF